MARLVLKIQCKFVPTSQISGGNTSRVLKEALKSGFCLEEDLFSEVDDKWSSSMRKTLSTIEEAKAHRVTLENEDLCNNIFPSAMALFPNISYTEFLEVLKTSMISSRIDDLAMKSCNKHFLSDSKVVSKTAESVGLEKQDLVLFDEIDTQFGKGNIVGMSYDARVLRDKNFDMTKAGFANLGKDNSVRLHASTLVGRRYNEATKSCEYLVRNSWGRSCQFYDESYACEEGHIWIPKEGLSRRLSGINYLE